MPRYQQIADDLRSEILAGRYAPTQRLPSQKELAKRWKTTIITIRRAIAELQEEGWLRVEHGTGTFVGDPGRYADLFHLASFEQDLAARGISVTSHLVSVDRSDDAEAASVLGRTEPAGLVRVVRLRSIGDRPILYQESFIAADDEAKALAYQGQPSLYTFLRESLGLIVAGYTEDIASTTLDGEIADHLALEPGSVGLRSVRTSVDSSEAPVVYDRAYLPSSRVRLRVERFGVRVNLQYLPTLDFTEASTGPQEVGGA